MTNLDFFSKILSLFLPESYWAKYLSNRLITEKTQKILTTKVGMGILLHNSESLGSKIFIYER